MKLSSRYFSVFRGFKFDRMFESTEPDPNRLTELDHTAMTSINTLVLPHSLREKLEIMLKQFGRKQDLEKMGRYLIKKLNARTSVEIPRALPSKLVPNSNENNTISRSLTEKHLYSDVSSLDLVNKLTDNADIHQEALAYAEDSRHKLFKVSYSPETALAYSAHLYTGAFGAFFRILYEVSKRLVDFKPQTIMEYGAGPAPGIAAAHHIWESGFEDVLAIEPSVNMTNVGKFMTSDFPNVRWQGALYEEKHLFDMAILSYCLMNLDGHLSRSMLIRNIWNRLNIGGVMIIVERGTPTGFRFIHSIRELFITEIKRGQYHFVAPCPHESICPISLTGKDWCHFSQRIHRIPHYIYCKGSRSKNVEEEKFSFLVIRKSMGPRDQFREESNAPTVAAKSFFWPRIVMPVINAGQHTLLDVCSYPHSFERLTVSKSMPHSAGYRFARKASWGDLWRFPKRICRPEARSYLPEETSRHLQRLAQRIKQLICPDCNNNRQSIMIAS